jgi:hypothetical protein
MRFHKFALELLENRAMLAANITAETATVVTPEPLPGDANLDGTFDQLDLLQVLQADKYLTDKEAEWSDGDWNGDDRFDQVDLVVALQTGQYDREIDGAIPSHSLTAKANGRAVPRPMKAVEKITITVDPSMRVSDWTAEFHFDQVGHGTHLGAFHNVDGVGVWDLVNQAPLSMETTLVAANGDTLHGASDVLGFLYFDGGTGRFEDAHGFSNYTTIWASEPTLNPDNTFTITVINKCEGEITF